MKTIKIIFNQNGSIQPVAVDFKLYRGEYNQVEIMVYIPKCLLIGTVLDEAGNIVTTEIVKVGAIIHKANGQAYTTQDYTIPLQQEQIIDGIKYAIYCRRLPKVFTLWETIATELGQRGELQMVFNLLQTRQENNKTIVESILTSPIIAIPVYPSVYLSVDEAIEIDKIDELAGNIDSLRLIVQNDMATKLELKEVNTNKVDKVQVEAGKLLLSNGIGGIQASTIGIQEYEDQKEYIDEKHAEQEQRMDGMQTEISANTKERHVHANKELLDRYTVENTEIQANTVARHEHANKEILDDVTEAFTTALKGNVEGSITSVELDNNTGIFTFTKNNGEEIRVDTLLEKVIVNFRFDKERQALILISEDGTEQEVELGALLSLYQGTDGTEITVTVDRNNNIGASIKAGAVTEGKIGDYAVTEIKLHQTILDKFTQLQTEIERLKEDREQIIKDSWLYHHPVGSCILTMGNENPNDRGGGWELVQAGYALWTTQGTDAGGTIEAGLPNITGYDATAWGNLNPSGAFIAVGWDDYGGLSRNTGRRTINFDASRSNPIYGRSHTVQPPAVKIRLWKRIF